MKRLQVQERANWRETAKSEGFQFSQLEDEAYWDETACFSFTLSEIERNIEAPSTELHAMCLDLVDRTVDDDELLTRLGIAPGFHDLISQSWRAIDPTIVGRLDLAYDGKGPAKLLEYNADTPTSLYEAAVFQWKWLEEALATGIVQAGSDQFNSIHERLINAYRQLRADTLLHFTCYGDNLEDFGTTAYMMDCALQAGHQPKFIDIRQIGRDAEGRFTDENDLVVDTVSKLYPWEWLFADEFGQLIPRSGALFVEPAWKAILSTKGILPLLWEAHPGHPNLLPAFFEGDPKSAILGNFVRKPMLSREGANITIVRDGQTVASTEGRYGDSGYVVQQEGDLFTSSSGHAVLGSWIISGESCGIGIREDTSLITGNTSRFLPHIIDGNGG